VFTRALRWSLFWARSIQSIPSHPISLRSILILFTHLRLGLSSDSYGLERLKLHTLRKRRHHLHVLFLIQVRPGSKLRHFLWELLGFRDLSPYIRKLFTLTLRSPS
jgi:hypothetical protein